MIAFILKCTFAISIPMLISRKKFLCVDINKKRRNEKIIE